MAERRTNQYPMARAMFANLPDLADGLSTLSLTPDETTPNSSEPAQAMGIQSTGRRTAINTKTYVPPHRRRAKRVPATAKDGIQQSKAFTDNNLPIINRPALTLHPDAQAFTPGSAYRAEQWQQSPWYGAQQVQPHDSDYSRSASGVEDGHVEVPAPPATSEAEWYSSMGMLSLAQKAKRKGGKPRGKATVTPVRELRAPGADLSDSQQSLSLPPPASPKSTPRLSLLKRPEPTWTYLKQAEREAAFRSGPPRRLLVVLDLNGTLVHRKKGGGSNFTARVHVPEFLHYLLTNHKVMIWSSARPENVKDMCAKLFTKTKRDQLVAIWARDKLRLTPHQYNEKVQVYKQLSWVWRDHDIDLTCAQGEIWDQDNTVLIDDSVEKAASEPFNLIKIDEYCGGKDQLDMLGPLIQYLEVLKTVVDVSSWMRVHPFRIDHEAAPYDWMPLVNDMH
ncbi:hypothetical protein BAUCODRAFT_33948 [Baudoinia panamericana UAMH 10762]|uniref:Mitochondrial import inner membrane translocase subunit TIM50 n=1 Tax=Baudoinia panamericana (strain UAMH 10762) TaxID=717646 RepID=M2LQA2_BAUPA|nr:uncharacterized protein BAUCODRAFT_33948 [Baudoinia panamericana UAMH 10762]EMC96587.1 hypothetical protein BAUCODRAFT_33948 [Baudoinia panamericana UAMH 10762]